MQDSSIGVEVKLWWKVEAMDGVFVDGDRDGVVVGGGMVVDVVWVVRADEDGKASMTPCGVWW